MLGFTEQLCHFFVALFLPEDHRFRCSVGTLGRPSAEASALVRLHLYACRK